MEADLSEVVTDLWRSLEGLPAVEGLEVHFEPEAGRASTGAAITVQTVAGRRDLFVEVKSSGEPRFVREAAFRLRDNMTHGATRSYGLLIAPFISEESRAILRKEGLGWLDAAGNRFLSFDSIHIEIAKADANPFTPKRKQKSLFSPKTARVLRIMLSEPGPWKGTELSVRAKVSGGQISKVRELLLDHEWATANSSGLKIVRPLALLQAWRENRRSGPRVLSSCYTVHPDKALQTHLNIVFGRAQRTPYATVLLAAHSVARRVAPYARVAGEYLYADTKGLELLNEQLRLEEVDHGPNITVFDLEDEFMALDSIPLQPEPLRGTSLIQTYLDLSALGERGREAADFLLEEKIKPHLGRVER